VTTLFQFNTSAIGVLSADGFEDRLEDVLNDVRAEIEDELAKRSPDDTYDVGWEKPGIAVTLTPEQFDREYGVPPKTMNPVVRLSLMAAAGSLHNKLVLHE